MLPKPNVLIVMPDGRLRRILYETLIETVTATELAHSIEDAMKRGSIIDTHIAIIDSDSIGQKVQQTIADMKHVNPEVQLVFLSSYIDDDFAAFIHELGGWGVISKEDLTGLPHVISEIALASPGEAR